MHYEFKTKNVCSSKVSFDLDDGIVTNINFKGGCDGNLKAISKILEGAKAEDIISKLSGNDCRGSGTSCADQFAKALEEAVKEQ